MILKNIKEYGVKKICVLYAMLFCSSILLEGGVASHSFDPTRFDVIITCHYKDFETLPLCIESVKKNITFQNPNNRIFVISNREITGKDFTFVPESKFYKFIHPCWLQKHWSQFNRFLTHRAFWLFQQFLKLGASLIIDGLSENYLSVDADTIWLKPQHFLTDDNKIIYSEGDEYHVPYRDCFKCLLHEDWLNNFCFVHHHFMWNQTLLKELFSHIENLHHKPWYQAIVDCMNYNEVASFSEYELWGHWLQIHHPEMLHFQRLNAKDIFEIPSSLTQEKFQQYDFVTAHWWARHGADVPNDSPCANYKLEL